MKLKIIALLILVLGMAAALGLATPYLGAEYLLRQHGAMIGPRPQQAVRGRWVDDYFLVETLGPGTYAIGEPRYYQGNYGYLLVGSNRALLFDAGSGRRDIAPVVRALTALPVTVLPSHLHFDHVGSIGHFERTALPDRAELRDRVRNGRLLLQRYEFLGFADALPPPAFVVDEWWPPGRSIDLGGRQVRVLATPGHTPSSIALYDAEQRQLFAGDFIYPGTLYAFLPGASRSEYLATARTLLRTVAPGTRIYAAHMADHPSIVSAPVLEVEDLRALAVALVRIGNRELKPTGYYPRIYPVRGVITFATGFSWNNR